MRYIGILLQILLFSTAFGQYPQDNKRDHIWMFGEGYIPQIYSGTVMNFNGTVITTDSVIQQPSLYLTNASISSPDGNLLFYTNGMQVSNVNHQYMSHGDSLNYGQLYLNLISIGYALPQGALVLPKPGSNNLYYIFHEKVVYAPAPYIYLDTVLYYSVVNMNLIGGLGDVTQKNVPILNDTLDPGAITACRHANGRDWWILIPEAFHNHYYRLLLCPQGLVQESLQVIGTSSSTGVQEAGVASFSPDGTKYCRYGVSSVNTPYRLEVFDFDRCSGTLSNYHNLWFTNTIDSVLCPGIAISSNSRFLYITTARRVIQYDLLASNIGGSQQTVAIYDGYVDPQSVFSNTEFGLAQLACDNKVYITGGSSHYLHVIQNPDSGGWACNVLQHSIQLDKFNDNSIPNFPNFRLGPIDGSPCDTLGIDIVVDITNPNNHNELLSIWPNPASSFINYRLGNNDFAKNYSLVLFDQLGHQIKFWKIPGNKTLGNFDISDCLPGVYTAILMKESGETFGLKKVVVIR